MLAFVDSSIGSGESIWRKFIGCTEFNGRTALIHNEEHTRGRINTWVTKESSVACELIRGGAITRPRCAMGMRVKCVSRTNHSIWSKSFLAQDGCAMTLNGPFFKYGVSNRVGQVNIKKIIGLKISNDYLLKYSNNIYSLLKLITIL